MKTNNTLKRNLIVWSVIVSLFTALTLMAVNVDHFRDSLFKSDQQTGTTSRSMPVSD